MDITEHFDILNRTGRLLGRDLPKNEVHQQGLWHIDVHVWLTDGRNYVEQQRAPDKDIMPGQWDIGVGGHVSAGEDSLTAAVRETREETGKNYPRDKFVYIGSLPVELTIPGWQRPHRTQGDHYVVYDRSLRQQDLVLEVGKATGFRMYPIEQLAKDIMTAQGLARHASQPVEMWELGLRGMRSVIARGNLDRYFRQ